MEDPRPSQLRDRPDAGEAVDEHTSVTIVVEEGAGKAPVPKLVGLSVDEEVSAKLRHHCGNLDVLRVRNGVSSSRRKPVSSRIRSSSLFAASSG